MRGQEAWGTLRHLVVEGSPQQAATMLSALLLGYADHGRDRASLLCEIAFAQLMADEADAAVSSARRALDEATRPACAEHVGPGAHAAATLALALSVRGPGPGTPSSTVSAALESASDLLVDLDQDDPVAPMTMYLVAETALLQGRFVAAEEVATRGLTVARGPVPSDPRDPIALVLCELVLARSLVLRGRRREGASLATRAADRAARLSMSSLEALARALEAVIASATGNRVAGLEAERRARRLSTQTGKSLCDVGTWLLLGYAAFLQGRYSEATNLVVTTCGGSDLPRLPWTLRTATFELLATAAVAQERLDEASAWLAGASETDSPPRADPRTSAVTALERGARTRTGWRAEAEPDLSEVVSGWHALTPRERHVAELASRGLSNRHIAERLFLNERAVRLHLERVFRVLGIHGRAMLPATLAGVVESRTLAPQVSLTERQESVAALVAEGHTNAGIAERLGMSVKTVEKHLRDVFARWGVNSRSAVASAWRDYAESRADGAAHDVGA
jgi:DNA-binding NarL/FixJ family response regulator